MPEFMTAPTGSARTLTVGTALRQATLELLSATPRLDAEALVMRVCDLTRAELITRAETALSVAQFRRLQELLARRRQGEPIAYLTGEREFWSLALKVTPATLIPRPETERLVEQAVACIPPDARWAIADLGTGSGAIALAVACERPGARLLATDISAEALAVAGENARALGIANVEFRQGDWLAPLTGEMLQVIVSNPPYVRANDPHLQAGDVRFEPRAALVAGSDGLAAIRRIADEARHHLKPGGRLLLEHGYDQAAAVADILRAAGYREIVCHRDLAGHERVTEGRVESVPPARR